MMLAGVDIGGTTVKIGLVDSERGLLQHTQIPSTTDPKDMAQRIAQAVTALPQDVQAVGIGTAGRVDPTTGYVTAGNLNWYGVPLRTLLADALKKPVWIDNDAQAALMAEWCFGACQEVKNAIYLTFGTGIGGAMLLDGRLYRGWNNGGGELGHFVTHARGFLCECGMQGCYECYASATALSRMAEGRPAREVIDAAKAGDVAMCAVFQQYVEEIAMGLCGINMIFAPEMIVLGGGISAAGEFLREAVWMAMRRMMPNRPENDLPALRLATFRNEAGMIGAAELARMQLRITD
ncbi:MAG: ROK family protein [Clostridia bacterium]